MLIRYSLAPVSFTNEKGCTVKAGLWLDPYTGSFYSLASDLDVEHIVPLSWSHSHGGAGWSLERKRQFAKDPENLWLVDDGHNQSKGDRGPDEWMPPYESVKAIYVERFMAIVEKYGLWATEQEAQLTKQSQAPPTFTDYCGPDNGLVERLTPREPFVRTFRPSRTKNDQL